MATYNGDSGNNSYTGFTSQSNYDFAIYGNDGNDKLTLVADREQPNTSLRTIGQVLNGGAGNDKLTLTSDSQINGVVLFENTLTGGAGSNSMKIAISSKTSLVQLSDNSLSGGEGMDTFDLSAKAGPGFFALNNNNVIFGGDGNDSVKIASTSSYGADIFKNDLDLGAGAHKVSMTTKTTGSAYSAQATRIAQNTVSAGSGNDSISMNSSGNNEMSTSGNELNLGNGDNKVAIKIASKTGAVATNENAFVAGNGKDSFSISAKSSGGEVRADDLDISLGTGSSNSFKIALTGETSARLFQSQFEAIGDKETFQITSKSDGGTSEISNNTITGGDGAHTIKLTATGGKSAYYTEIDGNEVEIGAGKDKIDFRASAKSGEATIDGNQFFGSAAGDAGSNSFKLTATGAASPVSVTGNVIESDGDRDSFSLSAKSKDRSDVDYNEIVADGDSLKVDLKSDAFDFSTTSNNSVTGGDGVDKINLLAKSKNANAAVDRNIINGSGGNDAIQLSATGSITASADRNDLVEIGSKTTLKVTAKTANGRANDNTLTGGSEDNEIDLTVIGGAGMTSADENSIAAGNGDNEISLSITQKGGSGLTSADENTLEGGTGDDKISFEVTGPDELRLFKNEIDLGSGDNMLDLSITKGSEHTLNANTIIGGDGDDSVVVESSKSTGLYSTVSLNAITLGNGMNRLDIGNSGAESVYISDNVISGGDNEDHFSFEVQGDGKDGDQSAIRSNNINTGNGSDYLSFSASDEDILVQFNYFDAGDAVGGGDRINVEIGGRNANNATFRSNTLLSGSGDDAVVIDIEATTGNIGSNLISTGSGNDSIEISLEGDLTGSGFIVDAGANDDTISVDFDTPTNPDLAVNEFLFNSNFNGGLGTDKFLVETDNQTIDLQIAGLQNMEILELNGRNTFLESINDTAITDITDANNTLFIRGGGDDTVQLDAGWSFLSSSPMLNSTFNSYSFGSATLHIENGIDIV